MKLSQKDKKAIENTERNYISMPIPENQILGFFLHYSII